MKRFAEFLSKHFPSTFAIAVVLSIITFLLAFFLTSFNESYQAQIFEANNSYFLQIIDFWYTGMWNSSMLAFAVQMMLILVLGYSIASAPLIYAIIDKNIGLQKNFGQTVFILTLSVLVLSFLNWGVGLIFGAIAVRKTADYYQKQQMPVNFALLGAAGYSGLMVWHGGLSGSAPLKIAETGHLQSISGLPLEAIGLNNTLFTTMNLVVTFVLLITIPLLFKYLAAKTQKSVLPLKEQNTQELHKTRSDATKVKTSKSLPGRILGGSLLFVALLMAYAKKDIGIINPNYINLILLGLALLLHPGINSFLTSLKDAMPAASGILIQFPLYFGIMGIMKESGLVIMFSDWLIRISNPQTLPLFTFFSAALVNLFVPSGGGQWAVQGPVIIHAATQMDVSLPKTIMAFAYGDQISNMLQPFWAIPLLGITRLKVGDILPYTLLLMVLGLLIFIGALLIF